MSYERQQRMEAAKERSGFLAESEMVGSVDTDDPEYRRAAEQWYGANGELVQKFHEGRLSERERGALFSGAWRLIENLPEYQLHPERTTNPGLPLLRDLRIALADRLEFVSESDLDRIKAFTAVGTPIDKHLGIDFFLRVDPKDRSQLPIRISGDYSIESSKTRTRADVLVKQLPNPDTDADAYVAAVDQVADGFVFQYRRQLMRTERPRR